MKKCTPTLMPWNEKKKYIYIILKKEKKRKARIETYSQEFIYL
jgi:hypothetical protein